MYKRQEQIAQLLLGQREDVGRLLLGEPVQGRPHAGRAPYGEGGVHAGAWPEGRLGLPRPQGRRVGHQGRVGEAVHLDDRRPRGARALGIGVEDVVRGQVQAQGDPDARVHAGGDLRRPVVGAGQGLGFAGGERPARGVGGGRGAGQGVGHRVEEGPDECLRLGEPERAGVRQRHGVALRGQGRGHRAQVGDVVGFQRAGTPGVVAARGQAGQQAAAGDQPQRVQGGGAPAGGGRVGGRVAPGPDQQWQGLGERQGQRGDLPAAHARTMGSDHGQLVGVAVGGQRAAVGIPEGDAALAREGRGQVDGGEAHRNRGPGPPGTLRALGHRSRATAHTSCHLPPVRRIRRLRLYGRGLTTGSGPGARVTGHGSRVTGPCGRRRTPSDSSGRTY